MIACVRSSVGVHAAGDGGHGGNLGPGPGGGHDGKPGSAQRAAKVAIGRNLDRDTQRRGDGAEPVVGFGAAADGKNLFQPRAGGGKGVAAVAEGEGYAIEHRMGHGPGIRFMA